MASARDGGITTTEGLLNVHPQEAIIPIEKFSGMFSDAMGPVTSELQKLVKGFGGNPGTDGEYISGFAQKVPKKTQIDSGII